MPFNTTGSEWAVALQITTSSFATAVFYLPELAFEQRDLDEGKRQSPDWCPKARWPPGLREFLVNEQNVFFVLDHSEKRAIANLIGGDPFYDGCQTVSVREWGQRAGILTPNVLYPLQRLVAWIYSGHPDDLVHLKWVHAVGKPFADLSKRTDSDWPREVNSHYENYQVEDSAYLMYASYGMLLHQDVGPEHWSEGVADFYVYASSVLSYPLCVTARVNLRVWDHSPRGGGM